MKSSFYLAFLAKAPLNLVLKHPTRFFIRPNIFINCNLVNIYSGPCLQSAAGGAPAYIWRREAARPLSLDPLEKGGITQNKQLLHCIKKADP